MSSINQVYGTPSGLVKNVLTPVLAERAPTELDVGYLPGTPWVDLSVGSVSMSGGTIDGNAIWPTIPGSGSGFPISPFVVGPSGKAGYQTVQSAINAANTAGGGTVYVQPGTYTENLTLFTKVDLIGATAIGSADGTVTIIGTHTPPSSGTFSTNNIFYSSTTSIFSSAAAGTTSIYVEGCNLSAASGYSFNLANWTGSITVFNCGSLGANDGFVNNATGSSNVFAYEATIGSGLSNAASLPGTVFFFSAEVNCPVTISGPYTLFASVLNGTLTTSGSASGTIGQGDFSTGANSAISQGSSGTMLLSTTSINTSATNAIAGSGAGTITLSGVDFIRSSAIAGTLTLSNAGRSLTGGLNIVRGTNSTVGVTAAMSGTPGAVTVTNSSVLSTSTIIYSRNVTGGTEGNVSITAQTTGSFTLTSTGNETSTFNYLIIN